MGGVCSRKRGNQVNEDGVRVGVNRRYCKNGSSKWLQGTPFFRTTSGCQPEDVSCPSLMELCIHKARQDIDKYSSFSVLPRDISQQIFDELVLSNCLTETSLEAFRDCALQDIYLGDYLGVDDGWIDVISSQGSSLLSVDLSGSDVTDSGLALLKSCSNLQALTFNYCDHISQNGLRHLNGLSNLSSLSFRRSVAVTAEGMRAFSSLVNLHELDLERCSGIHGGFIHLKGLKKLKTLNIRYCKCVTDSDMQALSELSNLKELQVSCSSITDAGVAYLKGLQNLILLNLEGCQLSAACLNSISGYL